MLPVCVASSPLHARACILSADKKSKSCKSLASGSEISEHAPGADDDEILKIQKQVVVQVLAEQVRYLLEMKESGASAVSKVYSMCEEFSGITGGDALRMVKAVMVVLSDKASSVDEVLKAPTM